jgi:MFS family permease
VARLGGEPRGSAARLRRVLQLRACRALLPLFAQGFGAGPLMVGFVVAASTLTGIVVKLPAGALSDVLGRKSLLLAGALGFALRPFAYLAVSTLAGLVVLRIIHRNATAIFGPVAAAAVSDLAPPDRRGCTRPHRERARRWVRCSR